MTIRTLILTSRCTWTTLASANTERPDSIFILADDLAETDNLAGEHPEMVERMTQLAQRYISNGRSTPEANQANNGETNLYPGWIRKSRP